MTETQTANTSNQAGHDRERLGLPATPEALLEAVLAANQGTENPRLKRVLDLLLRHLHAFAREIELSLEELEVATDFLVRIGKATGPEKHEGILLADILGLATLVGLNDARKRPAPVLRDAYGGRQRAGRQ